MNADASFGQGSPINPQGIPQTIQDPMDALEKSVSAPIQPQPPAPLLAPAPISIKPTNGT